MNLLNNYPKEAVIGISILDDEVDELVLTVFNVSKFSVYFKISTYLRVGKYAARF